MIRDDAGVSHPGSFIPAHPLAYLLAHPDDPPPPGSSPFMAKRGWERGGGFLIKGPVASHKTTFGLSILRALHDVAPELQSNYWTEADFFQDQRELWSRKDMAQRMTFDDIIWKDHLDWEREFLDLKESPVLFLDNVGMGYTPSHTYELSNLLRSREDRGLVTIVAANTSDWDKLPKATKALFDRHTMLIDTTPYAGP